MLRNIGDIKCKNNSILFWLCRLVGYGTTLSQWNNTGSSPVRVVWLTKPKCMMITHIFYELVIYIFYKLKVRHLPAL